MKRKSLLTAALLTFLMMQACQSPERRAAKVQSAPIDSALEKDIITDTTGISRGAGISVFMTEAATEGMMKLELAKIAVQKATNPRIQKYAKMVVKDHEKIGERLKKLAEDKKITLPTTLPQADLNHLDELRKMPANDFEKHFVDMMVKGHKKILDLYKAATTSGDTPLERFARSNLSKLEAHYKGSVSLDKKLYKHF
ncbi:DUF4142 domain-containing protein [Pedobacter nyackensis]|uniref:DUF4142 domain-containing protein n=1 Tax=Pedobacter nyackensis TaxID=475255 RepID=UPI00292E603D|nr:DUF4142 domain-containing protein [Pedobacter nyackensis]